MKQEKLSEREKNVILLLLSDEAELKDATYTGIVRAEDKDGNPYAKEEWNSAFYNGGKLIHGDIPCKVWADETRKVSRKREILGTLCDFGTVRGKRRTTDNGKTIVFDNAAHGEKRDLSAGRHDDGEIYLNSEYAGTGNGYYYKVLIPEMKKVLMDID